MISWIASIGQGEPSLPMSHTGSASPAAIAAVTRKARQGKGGQVGGPRAALSIKSRRWERHHTQGPSSGTGPVAPWAVWRPSHEPAMAEGPFSPWVAGCSVAPERGQIGVPIGVPAPGHVLAKTTHRHPT